MTKNDLFSSPKRRIVRAKEHINNLNAHITDFWGTNPYARVVDLDPNGREETVKVKLVKRLPPICTDLAFEAAEALRSALDQSGYAAAAAANSPRLSYTYFPIADCAGKLNDVIKGRCKDLPPEIVALFRSFNPHKGGNNMVWALNQICNSSKHRLLTEFGTASTGALHIVEARGPGAWHRPNWDSKKNEMKIVTYPIGSKPHYNFNVAFFVAFGEVPAVKGLPALNVLEDMAAEVERIVLATEAEAKRIGLTG